MHLPQSFIPSLCPIKPFISVSHWFSHLLINTGWGQKSAAEHLITSLAIGKPYRQTPRVPAQHYNEIQVKYQSQIKLIQYCFLPSSNLNIFLHNLCLADDNECENGTQPCGEHANCTNTEGSYYCTCMSGFKPSNGQQIFVPNDGTSCVGKLLLSAR